MSHAAAQPPEGPMTVEEFLRWHETVPETEHYELEGGRPVAMAPERAVHAQAKAAAWLALREAVRGLPCQAYVDGLLVPIGQGRAYQPDALLRCGPPLPPEAQTAEDPVVVVEVASPSSTGADLHRKLQGYFRVPSVAHYLVVLTEERRVIHHRRAAPDAVIETRILAEGAIALDPPGISVAVEALLPP